MHFVQINIIVRTGNLWLSNGSCHIVPSDAIKALFAWTVLERFRMIPRQDAASSKENKCHSVSNTCSCSVYWKPELSNAVCDSLCLWTQCSLAVRSIRALQVSLSSRQESKKWLHWSKWNKNNRGHSNKMSPICQMSYVHLKTNSSFFLFFFLYMGQY